jgi:hypothetical protein
MSVWITDDEMSSDVTTHHATRVPTTDRRSPWVWRLSFLPPWWLMDRNQAITAMTLAETVATGDARDAALIADLAAELGMTAGEAITRITSEPEREGPGQ